MYTYSKCILWIFIAWKSKLFRFKYRFARAHANSQFYVAIKKRVAKYKLNEWKQERKSVWNKQQTKQMNQKKKKNTEQQQQRATSKMAFKE